MSIDSLLPDSVPGNIPMKRCPKCKEWFPPTLEYFAKNSQNKSNLASRCRHCNSIASYESQKRHRDRANKSNIRWRQNNPEKYKASRKKSRANHLEQRRQESHNHRAKIKALPYTFTDQDWRHALTYFNDCCAYCGHGVSLFDQHKILQQDHFVASDSGGGYVPTNIVPACQNCNQSKHNKSVKEWLISKFGKQKAAKILKRIQDYSRP